MNANDRHYDFIATVSTLHPFSFTWKIVDSANASGTIKNTMKAERKGTVLHTSFSLGDVNLNDKTTSLFVKSKNVYKQFAYHAGKPVTMQLSEGGESEGMGTFTGNNDVEIKINGTPINVKEELVKPLVKLGM